MQADISGFGHAQADAGRGAQKEPRRRRAEEPMRNRRAPLHPTLASECARRAGTAVTANESGPVTGTGASIVVDGVRFMILAVIYTPHGRAKRMIRHDSRVWGGKEKGKREDLDDWN